MDNNNQGNAPAWPVAKLPEYRADYRRRNPLIGTADAPKALAERKQWLIWRYEPGEDESKKYRKVPYYADGGRRFGDQGSDKDRRRLCSMADAVMVVQSGEYDGLGFAFLPGDGLIGIDLDGMINPETGEVSERCENIIDACDSYTEVSPSGTGVHIFCELEHSEETKSFKSNKIGVECFIGAQFFTFTGRLWSGSDYEIRPINPRTFARLKATVDAAKKPVPAAGSKTVQDSAPKASGGAGKYQRSAAETVAIAEDALKHLAPDDYQQWIDMGMACKAGLGTAGFLVWDAWSSKSPKYVAGEMAKRWDSFSPSDIDLAALFSRAEAAGWESPWAKAAKRKAAREEAKKRKQAKADEDRASYYDVPPLPDSPPETIFTASNAPAEGGDAPPVGPVASLPPAPPDDDDWGRYFVTKKGDITSCLANAELILSHHPAWRGVIGFDEFAERTMFRKPLPFARAGASYGEWSDHLDAQAAIWMQRTYGVEFSPGTVLQAVEVVARQNRFHPVRDALNALPAWDGVKRNDSWLIDYLNVADTEYVRLASRFFLIGMIKRVMEPGCKFDYCLVLEGEQGLGKSTAVRILGWNWYADTDLDLSNKDSLLALPGHWVYEISEMGSLMRAEEKKQKSFLSRQDDEYRPPYGKRMIKVPRQVVFIGTTNEEEYLKDPTGGRRFWPVYCVGPFNLDGLRENIMQMYAEALHDYRSKARCFPDGEHENALFTREQIKRGMDEPVIDLLSEWVKNQTGHFTMAQAATEGLGLTADKLTPAMSTRIGMALKKMGCGRKDLGSGMDSDARRPYVPPHLRSDVFKGPKGEVRADF